MNIVATSKGNFNILLDIQCILNMHIYETKSKLDLQKRREKGDDKIYEGNLNIFLNGLLLLILNNCTFEASYFDNFLLHVMASLTCFYSRKTIMIR